jgi:hypothetical protein
VSESIGLGQSSRRERSWWEAPKPRGSCLRQGPWPAKSRLAASRKRRRHPQLRVAIERSRPRDWLHQWATADEVLRSYGDSWLCSRVVSIAEVDKRRVAPRARGRRVRGADDGSSPPTRERSGRRKSVGSRIDGGKAARSVAGSRKSEQPRKRCPWEHLSRKGALGWESRPSLTRGAVEAALVLRGTPGFRMASGHDRERQRSSANTEARPTTPGQCGAAHGRPPALRQSRDERCDVCTMAKAGGAPSSASQPGSDCRKVVRCRSEEPDLGRGSIQRSPAARATSPVVERFTGARVVSRLQRSV